jgi:hypothetical protein
MELVSCHPSGDYNFEVAPRFLENLCTPVANYTFPSGLPIEIITIHL